jgi:hypothetical protein
MHRGPQTLDLDLIPEAVEHGPERRTHSEMCWQVRGPARGPPKLMDQSVDQLRPIFSDSPAFGLSSFRLSSTISLPLFNLFQVIQWNKCLGILINK